MRALRILGIVAVVLVVVAIVGYRSGNQPRRDAVAAAERDLGIDLETRRVNVGEVELFTVLAGPADGPPVVLLHGFPEFWYAWEQQMGRLAAAGFRVIVPDQRGYDQSDKPGAVSAYAIDKLAGDIAGLIQALGYDSAFVAGHDWGGGVAWQVALRHPERVRKLAILDTPHPLAGREHKSTKETVSWYRTFFQIPWIPEWAARLNNWQVQADTLRNTARPGAFSDEKLDLYRSAWDNDGAMSTMIHWYRAAYRNWPPDPPQMRIAIPTLLIIAPNDAFIASDLSRASMKYLDRGVLIELPEGTHWVLQEDPVGTSRLLIDFFSK